MEYHLISFDFIGPHKPDATSIKKETGHVGTMRNDNYSQDLFLSNLLRERFVLALHHIFCEYMLQKKIIVFFLQEGLWSSAPTKCF